MYKLTFCSLKIGPKNCPQLMHRSKTEIKKSSGQIFRVNIAYLKENSKIKDKFFKKILTQKIQNGGSTYINGSTYTQVNMVY